MTDTHQPEDVAASPSVASLHLIQNSTDQIFAHVLDPTLIEADPTQFQSNATVLGADYYPPLEAALQDLQRRGQALPPELKASLEFLLGRESYSKGQIEAALAHYQQSLSFWQRSDKHSNKSRGGVPFPTNPQLERQGAVLFHIGLCYSYWGNLHPTPENRSHWETARTYLERCLEIFEQLERKDLVAKFISQQAEILQQLEAWSNLQAIVQRALELHIVYGPESLLAQDYGYLAEAALHDAKWVHASQLAELAAAIETQSFSEDVTKQGSYVLLLAESQQQLREWQSTINQLEEALKKTDFNQDLHGYLRILKGLHKLYFDQAQYRKAIQLKKEQQTLEYQFGMRPFMGVVPLQPKSSSDPMDTVAEEIIASNRMQDVNRLVERIQQPDRKLIVIYGESGGGKSSLINAGLVPKLLQPGIMADTVILPIVLRVYTDWLRDPDPKTWNLTAVLEYLQENDQNQQLKVLIFDQFEEFFLVCTDLSQRLPFYEFLRDCLYLDSVKVILSMQTEFLHHLLECERLANLQVTNSDILCKEVRYYLGNFSPINAKTVIQKLTHQPQFQLEPGLMDQLIKDLGVELGDVRPIELQLVGAQMQNEGITTLEKYEKLGVNPKLALVRRFLETGIRNCGPENERTAQLVLYLLTDDKGTRLLKTKASLAIDLVAEAAKLDLVLDVLVETGLVLHLPDIPDDRYQLVHDYLVQVIRRQDGDMLIAELQLERDKAQRRLSEEKPDSLLDRAISSIFRWMRSD